MTIPQEAVEALTDEVYAQFNFQYGDFNTPSVEEAESILAAAEPHLRKKWAEELIDAIPDDLADDVREALGI